MRNALKRVLSTALAGLMLASVATVGVSANSGQKTRLTFKQACEQQWNEQLKDQGPIQTVEYMFYMPESMKNQYNDYYDGSDPSTYAAGIYWWEGTASPEDCYLMEKKGWPGYAVTRTAEDCGNVYIAEVPADVPTVVWNNSVDGGTDSTEPWYTAAMQSDDAGVTGYLPGMDTYGFYPDGLASMVGMIYVCNPDDTVINAASQKVSFKGEWFYYYGNGEYGIAPTREEAGEFVYKDGVFPPLGVTFSKADVKAGVGGTVTGVASKANATGRIEDETIATVAKDETTGTFTITGLKAGTTNLIIESFNEKTNETNSVTVPVTVTDPTFDETNITMHIGASAENTGYGLGENCVISYTTPDVVEYDGYEVVAKNAGTTTVNCTQGDYTYSFTVTVNGHKVVEDKAVAATCTKAGKTAGKHCSDCNEVIVAQKTVKAKGHGATKTVGAKKATYFAAGHTGNKVCKACNAVITKGKATAKLKLKAPKVTIKGGKKKITVKYKKVSGATGFQVKYKIGKKNVTKTFNAKKNVTKTIKKLKKGSYKVQVRAFVKQGSKKAYSSWTNAKKVKVK